jgi:hypothetical protein
MTEPIAPSRPEPGPPLRPGPVGPPDQGIGGGPGGFMRGRTAGIPNWGWLVGGVGAGLLLLWRFRKGKQSETDTTTSGGTGTNQTAISRMWSVQSNQYSPSCGFTGAGVVPGPAGDTGPLDRRPTGDAGTPPPAQTPTTPTPTPTPAPAPNLAPRGQTVSRNGRQRLRFRAAFTGRRWESHDAN